MAHLSVSWETHTMRLSARSPRILLAWCVTISVIAVGIGLLTSLSSTVVLGASLSFVILLLALTPSIRVELIVAVYWITFTTHQTVFASESIRGFYFPFYAAFAAVIVLRLVGPGIAVYSKCMWTYGFFLFVILVSLIGFADSIGSEVIQQLLAYGFAALVATQYSSRQGLIATTWAFAAGGVIVSTWVIASAVSSNFAYRAGVDVGQNTPAFFIGFGLVTAIVWAITDLPVRGRRWLGLGSLALVALMGYASLLLASRGMTVAVVAAVIILLARLVTARHVSLWPLLILTVLMPALLFMPGGEGFTARLEGEAVETGGDRFPIWAAVAGAYTDGSPSELLIGRGFGASRQLVSDRFQVVSSAHNGFLKILIDFGAVGLGLFLMLHAQLFTRAWRARGREGVLMLGLIAYLLGANLSGDASDTFLYWVAVGFLMASALWVRPSLPASAAPTDIAGVSSVKAGFRPTV